MFVALATVFLLFISQGQCLMNATAILHPADLELYSGTLIFTQENADSPVRITGSIGGLNASSAHGFHIHNNAVDENQPNCSAAGGHFNPYNTRHGPPTADITSRHVGDLGNITTDADGNVVLDLEDYIIQLYNATQSIADRTVVVHRLRDDGGEGGFEDSNTTGNAGPRLICGLIKIVSEDTTTTLSTTDTTPSPPTTTSTVSPPSSTTSTSASTTPSSSRTASTTPSPTVSPTTSLGLKIQPVMFILMITMIIDYVIRY